MKGNKAWVVWTPNDWANDSNYDYFGVVVYADTRGKARCEGGAQIGLDFAESMSCRVLRAPPADHLAKSRKQPPDDIMRELGFCVEGD